MNDAHLLGGALLTHHCLWGVAVIAGTGSVVISLEVDQNNEVAQTGRRGGTGYLLGDDGSGQYPVGLSSLLANAYDQHLMSAAVVYGKQSMISMPAKSDPEVWRRTSEITLESTRLATFLPKS